MSAMPERVWLLWGPDEVEPGAWAVESREGFPCYVPESRLLAAEARVREVEAELGAALDQVMIFGSDIDHLRAELKALKEGREP